MPFTACNLLPQRQALRFAVSKPTAGVSFRFAKRFALASATNKPTANAKGKKATNQPKRKKIVYVRKAGHVPPQPVFTRKRVSLAKGLQAQSLLSASGFPPFFPLILPLFSPFPFEIGTNENEGDTRGTTIGRSNYTKSSDFLFRNR